MSVSYRWLWPSTVEPVQRRVGTPGPAANVACWACALVLALGPGARAANLTWDSNGGTLPDPNDGGGTWTSGNMWWNGSFHQTWNSGTPDKASIGVGGTAGTIWLGTVTAGAITFNAFSGTYKIYNGALTLNGAMTVNNTAGSVTLGTALPISGTGSITVNSGYTGTLTLYTGGSTYSGGVTVYGGTLNASASGSAGPVGPLGTGTLTLDGAAMEMNSNWHADHHNPMVVTTNGATFKRSAGGIHSTDYEFFGGASIADCTIAVSTDNTSGNMAFIVKSMTTLTGPNGDITLTGINSNTAVRFDGGLTQTAGAGNARITLAGSLFTGNYASRILGALNVTGI